MDEVVPHRAGEHRQVFDPKRGRAEDRLVLVDVGNDGVDLRAVVTEPPEGPGYGLVDDRHRPAADQLLGLDQTQVGLDAGGVTIHQQADGVVADEAVGDVGDVVGHRQVVGQFLAHRARRLPPGRRRTTTGARARHRRCAGTARLPTGGKLDPAVRSISSTRRSRSSTGASRSTIARVTGMQSRRPVCRAGPDSMAPSAGPTLTPAFFRSPMNPMSSRHLRR